MNCNHSTQVLLIDAQENSKLRAEIQELKDKVDTFNSHLQRLDLCLLINYLVQMYTGLPRKIFDCLFAWLTPVLTLDTRGNDELSLSKKLLLVLMKLCCNFPQSDFACCFNVKQSYVSRILNRWIPLLKEQLKALIRWPQTIVGPTVPPYNVLPNPLPLLMGLKFLFSGQVIQQHRTRHIVTTKVIQLLNI